MKEDAEHATWVQWALSQTNGDLGLAEKAAAAALGTLERGGTRDAAADAARAIILTASPEVSNGLVMGEAAASSPYQAELPAKPGPYTLADFGKWVIGLVAVFLVTTCGGPVALVAALVLALLAIINPTRLGAQIKGWRLWSWVPGLGDRKSAVAFAAVLLLYMVPWSGFMTAAYVSAATNPAPQVTPSPTPPPTQSPSPETQLAQGPLRGVFSSQAPAGVTAGQTVDLVVKLENHGRFISDFGFSFASGDNWLDHNNINSSTPCTVDRSIKGFRCGSVGEGGSLAVDIKAVAFDAGHFQYRPDPYEYWSLTSPQAIGGMGSSDLAFNQVVDGAVAIASPTVAPTNASAPAPAQSNAAPSRGQNPPPKPPSAQCSASMSNPNPGRGGSDTLNVTSNQSNATITLTAHYKTTNSTYTGSTNGSGSGSVTFGIGHPSAGYTVQVDVTVGAAHCSTSFTPN